jgi:hypothetical protein
VTFIHEDPDFSDLLRIVAEWRGLPVALVEKDYWVTHVLWALHSRGFEIWFKGGTSLSKGFGLIERFSEDLDLKIEPGTTTLPLVRSWKSEGTQARGQRKTYFEALARLIQVAGADIVLSAAGDERWISANLEVHYQGRHRDALDSLGAFKPFVLLEVGSARVTPFVERDCTSFVHDYLSEVDQLADYEDDRPCSVRCLHPLVTLIEKLDSLHHRVGQADRDPATFVRHFEDAAHIIAAASDLPPLPTYANVSALADEMLAERQIRRRPASDDPAFAPAADERWQQIAAAHTATAPMFWGERIALQDSCDAIRSWIASELER